MSELNSDQQFEQGRQAFWNAAREQTGEQTELPTGKTALEESRGYREMESAFPVPKEPEGLDITDDREGFLRDAADELTKQRGEDRPGEKPVDITRTYTDTVTGEPKPETETLSVEQASWDLTGAREREKTTADQTDQAELAKLIDDMRNGVTPEQYQPQPLAQSAQPPPEQAPVDDDWQRHLQDPRLLNAVQQHTEQVNAQANQAIQAYNGAAVQAAQSALVGLVVSYPELAGVNAQQLPVALNVIARQNPQRAQDIVTHIGLINDTVKRGVEAQTAQAQQQFVQWRKGWNSWAATQDAHYEAYAKQVSPSERQAIEAEARQMVLEGSDHQSIALSWNTSQELRSAQAQRLLFDAARWRLGEKARQSAQRKIRNPVPHVQAPGSPLARASEEDYTARQLNKGGGPLSPKEAAALVVHQRAQRARGR